MGLHSIPSLAHSLTETVLLMIVSEAHEPLAVKYLTIEIMCIVIIVLLISLDDRYCMTCSKN